MSGDGWYNQFRPTTPIIPSFSDINFTTSLLTLKNKPFFRQLFYTSQLLHITRGTRIWIIKHQTFTVVCGLPCMNKMTSFNATNVSLLFLFEIKAIASVPILVVLGLILSCSKYLLSLHSIS
jgi:hypothetical protein